MFRLISLIIALGPSLTPVARAQEKGPYGHCAPAKAPLYRQQDINAPIDMTLMADHATLNSSRFFGGQIHPVLAVMAIKRPGEETADYIPVKLTIRGKSRGYQCQVKPLRIIFLNQKIEKSIEERLVAIGQAPGNLQYLKAYYQALLAENVPREEENIPQDNNIFDKLGDDVKFVTHCGKDEGGFVGGFTPEEQDLRLLSEYYIYKIVDELKAPVETARLAMVSYLDPNGNALYPGVDGATARPGFFREPPKSVAKRCGLLTKPPAVVQQKRIDQQSQFQLDFIAKFLFNRDYHASYDYGHNVNIFYDAHSMAHPGNYDFDLSGVIYNKDFYNGKSLEDNLEKFVAWLKVVPKDQAKSMLERTVAKRARMTAILENSLLPKERKTSMLKWLNDYMDTLERVLKQL